MSDLRITAVDRYIPATNHIKKIKNEYVPKEPKILLPITAACAGPMPGKKLTMLPEKVPASIDFML